MLKIQLFTRVELFTFKLNKKYKKLCNQMQTFLSYDFNIKIARYST